MIGMYFNIKYGLPKLNSYVLLKGYGILSIGVYFFVKGLNDH